MKLIDKDALVAEIEKLKETYSKCLIRNDYEEGLKEGRRIGYEDALHKINTSEVKEVDLEKELDSYFTKFKGLGKNNWNWRIDSINIHAQGIYDFARHFFELGIKATQKGK